jgi:riboflavin synthase alpha subunit
MPISDQIDGHLIFGHTYGGANIPMKSWSSVGILTAGMSVKAQTMMLVAAAPLGMP